MIILKNLTIRVPGLKLKVNILLIILTYNASSTRGFCLLGNKSCI